MTKQEPQGGRERGVRGPEANVLGHERTVQFLSVFCFLFFGASANPSEIQGAVEEEGAGSTDDTRPPNVTCAL